MSIIKTTPPYIRIVFVFVCLSILSACASTGRSPSEKRTAVLEMRQDVLSEIYKLKPDVRSQVTTAPGYAVFSNVNVNLLIASFGGGFGVVRDRRTGQDTYMNMGEVGIGIGAGVKDFRALFVFHSKEALNYFINKGWAFGAQADAAAKASDKGASVGGEETVNNISIYQITKSGLALQATIKGTKFWKSNTLN